MRIIVLLIALIAMHNHAHGQNLLTNGNFEQGNTGFTSEYTHSPTSVTGAETYAVNDNPGSVHHLFYPLKDHTTGSGKMLVVNGSTSTSPPVVWSQQVNVERNQNYVFSLWVSNLFGTSTSILAIRINGQALEPNLLVPDQLGQWYEVTRDWNSQSARTALIEIVFVSQAFTGNDTALDDFRFSNAIPTSCIDPSLIPSGNAYEDLQISATVPGNSNPFLAGQADGASTKSDSAPDESPVDATSVSPGDILSFAVSGSVSFSGASTPTDPPDGKNRYDSESALGIAGYVAPNGLPGNALVGVFLGNATPSEPSPAVFDYGAGRESFEILSPELHQIFFIGDGLTGNGTGERQRFVVPPGASRLFLGTSDGFGWFNNSGAFEVDICRLKQLPFGTELEPTTIKFDKTNYSANLGDSVMGTVEIDPIPPGGLYSQGLTISVRDAGGTMVGVINTGALPTLDFDGPIDGASASVPNSTGMAGIKGSAKFDTFRETSTDFILGSFIIDNLPPGNYSLAISPWNDLGPTEDIFVTKDCLTLDSFITYGTATLEIVGPTDVFPEITLTGEITLNRQTGLFEQRVTLQNNTQQSIEGFRLLVGGLPTNVNFWNKHGMHNGIPYIDISNAVAPGAELTLVLEYFNSERNPDFDPELSLGEIDDDQPEPGRSAPLDVDLRMVRKTGEGLLLEFLTDSDRKYIVEYSDNLTDWKVSLPPIIGTGQRIQWLDQGPPKTRSFPAGNRFYRIIDADATR